MKDKILLKILNWIRDKISKYQNNYRILKKGAKLLLKFYYQLKSKFTIKIFGIGLSRTGTKSLTAALEQLGYKSIHYPPINKLFDMVNKYDALTDISIACFYKLLDKKYRKSKFILTIRDLESWLKSCEKHIRLTKPSEFWQLKLRKLCYGTTKWNAEKYKKKFLTHLRDVKDYFKNRSQDLLILNIIGGEGYKELCSFLNKPIINKPFPHEKIH